MYGDSIIHTLFLLCVFKIKRINYFFLSTGFFADYAYGHPGGFNPFMLSPGWLDAAYMSYAWPDYFRAPQQQQQQQPQPPTTPSHHPGLSKGKDHYFISLTFKNVYRYLSHFITTSNSGLV